MKKPSLLILVQLLLPFAITAQIIDKPLGCFAGTNGTHVDVLSHPDARGVLFIENWYNIEPLPGVFDFTGLDAKIAAAKNASLKYSLAIAGGAFGSPSWLIDSLGASHFDYTYRNQDLRLPLWWDPDVEDRLAILTQKLGVRYAQDSSLSHIYVTQMTSNGVEGHLNGVDMGAFTAAGFTSQSWINVAKATTTMFLHAFPDKPIVFEVHEISMDTIIPSTIIDDLYSDPDWCGRVGLGMWWISGKITYQPQLIDYISNFQGDKYAQVIGRSDQPERFKDNSYSTVFAQAKQLGIRYIEPWPYEFQNHTHDSLLRDFNAWADANFNPFENCFISDLASNTLAEKKIAIYPNPTHGILNLQIDQPYQELKITVAALSGKKLKTTLNQAKLDISDLQNGVYFISLEIDGKIENKRILKME